MAFSVPKFVSKQVTTQPGEKKPIEQLPKQTDYNVKVTLDFGLQTSDFRLRIRYNDTDAQTIFSGSG
jgi:hypothetical protein